MDITINLTSNEALDCLMSCDTPYEIRTRINSAIEVQIIEALNPMIVEPYSPAVLHKMYDNLVNDGTIVPCKGERVKEIKTLRENINKHVGLTPGLKACKDVVDEQHHRRGILSLA